MRLALMLTIVAGSGIGLLIPMRQGERAASAVAPPSAEAAAAAGSPAVERPRETVLDRHGNGHFFAHAEVNGQSVRFLVDTGASTVALTMADARRIGVPFSPAEFQIIGSGASGAVRGQIVKLDTVTLDGKNVRDLSAVVIEGAEISLLGQSFLQHYVVEMQGGTMRIR